jgi:hypothetical protein
MSVRTLPLVALLVASCGGVDDKLALSYEGVTPIVTEADSGTAEGGDAAPVIQKPDPLCVPGASVSCTGPGACAGGQVCAVDGMSYGACECTVASVDAGPDAPDSVGQDDPREIAIKAYAVAGCHRTAADVPAYHFCEDARFGIYRYAYNCYSTPLTCVDWDQPNLRCCRYDSNI